MSQEKTSDRPPPRKKLIEVNIPLKAINVASAREKSIRHGHPSTLHLWWARRPLAACRAVLFCSLVDDPDHDPAFRNPDGSVDEDAAAHKRTELFDLIEALVQWENSNNPKVINAARFEIARCVASRMIETGELKPETIIYAPPGSSDDEGQPHPDGPRAGYPSGATAKGKQGKKATKATGGVTGGATGGTTGGGGVTAWRMAQHATKLVGPPPAEAVNHFLATYAPPVLDPFAGGGSIPLEAQRLGLRAHASDLNPVAVLINKALIEIPPKFANQPPVHPEAPKKTGWSGAEGLAEDVRRYGKWMRDEAEKRIGHLYPKVKITEEMAKDRPDLKPYVGEELTVIAWIWARTVPSPDPGMNGKHVPLVRSFWLSKKKGKQAYVEPVVDKNAGEFSFTVRVGPAHDGFDPENGLVGRKGGRCLVTGSPMPFPHIRSQGKAGCMKTRLMAMVAEGHRGRVYLNPLPEHAAIANQTQPKWEPSNALPDNPRDFKTPNYGMNTFGDLFTPRQLTALVTFSDLVDEVRAQVFAHATAARHSNPQSYADAVSTYLGLASSKCSDYWGTIATWATGEFIRGTFARQALPMTWDFAECNPLSASSGNWDSMLHWVLTVIEELTPASSGCAKQVSATSSDAYEIMPVISTDPPYYDNIGYADLSDYFYAWLRRSLRDVYPDLLSTMLTPKTEELIASPYRHDGSRPRAAAFFEEGLGRAIGRWRRHGHGDYPTTIFYAFKQAETDTSGTASTGWVTFLAGVIEHGFAVTATWPMRTERGARSMAIGTNALASSIVLACVPRPKEAAMATRREFAEALRHELPQAIRQMQSGNVAPVDLAQASIGPGMAVFSRFSKVVNADGTPMSVREALQLINQVLDEALTEQESDFDAETRFAIRWHEQYGMKEGPFGDAETLAKAMAVSVAGVVDAGIARSGAGKVRLLAREEMDGGWDPQADSRLTIWEVTQHLIRALETAGDAGAAALLRRLGSGAGETARELAYRLYQTCERKKWAEAARAYNGLVVAWPEIVKLSREKEAEPREEEAALFE